MAKIDCSEMAVAMTFVAVLAPMDCLAELVQSIALPVKEVLID
jgi:hypothetical protein